jgi:hypothetical protein
LAAQPLPAVDLGMAQTYEELCRAHFVRTSTTLLFSCVDSC